MLGHQISIIGLHLYGWLLSYFDLLSMMIYFSLLILLLSEVINVGVQQNLR